MIVRCSDSSISDNSDESTDQHQAVTFIKAFVINLVEATTESKDAESTEELDEVKPLEKVDSLFLKNEEIGLQYIENIMKEWHESHELNTWGYHIECFNKKNEAPLYFYVYEVKWSKPMQGYTFPIISVNVYVFLTMNSQDSEETIDMKYIFEGNRFVHSKDSIPFRPKFLIEAYESKKSLIESLNFKYELE